jgi:hypothetical protein
LADALTSPTPTGTEVCSLIARSVAALRKRGRPSSKGEGDEGDKEEGTLSKAKLAESYKVPTVS